MSETTARSGAAYSEPTGQRGTLVLTELWWRDRYYDIAKQGYELRPRYHPRWEPSWFKTGRDFSTVEDGIKTTSSVTMDATRIQDGLPVMLKKVTPWDGPHELRIIQQFSSPEHSMKRDNHCLPLLDIIELSGHSGSQQLMVFPLLRPFNRPRIQTFGEFAAFFTQICEGTRFMHQRNVAHRGCKADDITFDPSQMYPNGFHPIMIDRNRNFKGTAKVYTRTQRPPRYYFIDFSQSRQYTSRDTMDYPPRGGDKSAPEYRSGQRCNPFHTDIYYIGHLVRQEFMMGYNGFEFMEDLVASMTQDNPTKRPPIEDVLQEFSSIRVSLSGIKLRFAIISKETPKVLRIIWQAAQCVRTLGTASFPDWAVETVGIYERSDKRGWLTLTVPKAVRNNSQGPASSFIYNPSRASSLSSIASYKTSRTINSRKSRYYAYHTSAKKR